MTEPRYIVLDETGMVTNVVVGFIDLPAVGLIEQVDELMHVGLFWIYDAASDEFLNPYGSMPPATFEEEAI